MKSSNAIAVDVRAKVIDEVNGSGVDAQAAYDMIVNEMASHSNAARLAVLNRCQPI